MPLPLGSLTQPPHAAACASTETTSSSPRSLTGCSVATRWSAKNADAAIRILDSGDEAERSLLLRQLTAEVWPISVTRHGCRVAQAALDASGASERDIFTEAFKGRVWSAMKSPHANHVLQKCITVMPPRKVEFLLTELRGRFGEAARHQYGCRVLERLIEHCPAALAALSEEVLADAARLAMHPYGNYVVQHIFEQGTDEHRRAMVDVLAPSASQLARHKVASHVIEKAWTHSPSKEERQKLMQMLAPTQEALASLAASNFGSFVAKEMKKWDDEMTNRKARKA